MKKLLYLLMMVLGSTLFCDTVTSKDIPQPYLKEIKLLRDENIALGKQCQDLHKQIEEIEAKQRWNNSRIGSVSMEALNSLNISANDYVVDIDRMKIVAKKGK